MQTQKWVNLGLLLGSGILFLFVSKLLAGLWLVAGLTRFEDWPVTLDALVSFLIVLGVGTGVRVSAKTNQFFNEVAVELSKVTWPMQKETVSSSGVVVVLVSVAALILALVDLVWATISRGLFIKV